MKKIVLIALAITMFSCNGKAQKKDDIAKSYSVSKSDEEWKAQLTDMEYYVLRKSGTEPRYSSEFNSEKRNGTYVCKGCETPLFQSEHKYDSGSGWPSFDREISGNVEFSTDYDIGYPRTEEHCANCGGHLGHVFNDGPRETTGKRHCINGVALEFIPESE